MRSWTLGLLALLASVVGVTTPASALILMPSDPGRQCGWPINYPGGANYAFPDTSAAYFVQAAVLDAGDRITISGTDPKARYWSMQTYRYSDSSLIDSVNDVTVNRAKGRWSVSVVPPSQDSGRDPNVLSAAGAYDGVHFGSNLTVVMYRVYVSATSTSSGGAMPSVTLTTQRDGKSVTTKLATCRPSQVGPPDSRPVLSPVEGATTRFARGAAERFYASADTAYLGAQAAYDDSNILVITGRAPRTPKDVRYWSFCQNVNAGDLPVVDCLRDDEVHLDAQRRFRIAIVSDEQIAQADRAAYPGVDFISWGDAVAGKHHDAFVIYRNILPRKGFTGSVNRVPVGAFADSYLGEYAPVMSSMPRDAFDAAYRVNS